MRALLIEDDIIISKNLKLILNKRGYSVDVANNIEDGYDKLSSEDYDILVLDRGLPDGDGITLIERIRNDEIIVPILVLTAKNQDTDVVEGLNLGADDYLSKPFDVDILVARMNALIRRGKNIPLKPLIVISDLEIDSNSCTVKRAGKTIKLSPREYSMLEYLAINNGKALDRMTIMSHAWGEEVDLFSNTVDVHIKYLRNKIDNGYKIKLIKTVRGKGYLISE